MSSAMPVSWPQIIAIPASDTLPSFLGDNVYAHEFVHDALHFLGFPCD